MHRLSGLLAVQRFVQYGYRYHNMHLADPRSESSQSTTQADYRLESSLPTWSVVST